MSAAVFAVRWAAKLRVELAVPLAVLATVLSVQAINAPESHARSRHDTTKWAVTARAAEGNPCEGVKGKPQSYGDVNTIIDKAAAAEGVPPQLLKVIALKESSWKHFNDDGSVHVEAAKHGIGLFQFTGDTAKDYGPVKRLCSDPAFNAKRGAQLLKDKLQAVERHIDDARMDRSLVEAWLVPARMFNGEGDAAREYLDDVIKKLKDPSSGAEWFSKYVSPQPTTDPRALYKDFDHSTRVAVTDGTFRFFKHDDEVAQAKADTHPWAKTKPKQVDMELLMIAATLDQYRPGNGTTPHGGDDVKLVQQALAAKKYRVTVDGNFGAQTTAAYAKWQHRLGYSGLDANGLPGATSLKKLGKGRFDVVNVIKPGPRKPYGGVTLNTRTIAMVKAASKELKCELAATKGSYKAPDKASQATHAGGGVVDFSIAHLCGQRPKKVVGVLRKVGFAAWYRHGKGFEGNEHIHATATNDPDLSTSTAFPDRRLDARQQVVAFAQGQTDDRGGLQPVSVAPMKLDRLPTFERYLRAQKSDSSGRSAA